MSDGERVLDSWSHSDHAAQWLLRALTIVLTTTAGGCEEVLPPRNDPPEFLTVGFRSTVLVTADSGIVRDGWGTVHILVRNIYDEVLSEDALVRAQLTIRMVRKPEAYRVLDFGPLDLLDRRVLRGNTLTLGVDSVADLYKFWDHRDSDGTPFWEHFPLIKKFTDKGVVYYESDTLQFIAEGSVQIFENVQKRKVGPLTYPVLYQLWNMRVEPAKR